MKQFLQSLKDRTVAAELLSVYRHLPSFGQNIACSVEGWRIQRTRYATVFWSQLRESEADQNQSHAEYCALRDARLSAFIRYAVDTVPYYRDLFASLGATASDIRSLSDLKFLPVLEKRTVQENPLAFVSSAVLPQDRVKAHTSGTTGAGLHFYTTLHAQRWQWAVWWRYFRYHGIQPGTWCGYFGGRTIVPVDQKTGPFWRTNLPGRQVMFSAYHTTERNLGTYLEELRRRRLPWLHGYPSQIALLASHIVGTGFDLGYRPKWITLGAENLMPHQATLIERAFGTRPRQHYGAAEAVANFSECERGRLHIDEDFSAVELIGESNLNASGIVGTNFSNPAMPLIRYSVGDTAVLSEESCSCGRPGRVISNVDGRLEDYVELIDGARIGRLDHIFKDMTNVREAQIRQSRPGAVRVLLVKGLAYSEQDENLLLKELSSRLGAETRIAIEYVSQLERTKSGKLRFVVSDLPRNKSSGMPQ